MNKQIYSVVVGITSLILANIGGAKKWRLATNIIAIMAIVAAVSALIDPSLITKTKEQ